MEEDILYGKKRHLFGGLEPSNMKSLKFIAYDENVRLNVTLPEDTVVDGQVLCSVAGAMIRRKTDGYPKDEFDGVLVADVKVNGVYIDGDSSTGETYYYAAFPYTDQGVFNRSDLNRAKYNPLMAYYTFGYDLDIADPDPSTRVSYPSDVDNYGFEPARMNYDTDIFDYGDWNVSPGLAFMPKPCMLRNDGTVDHYLDPNNYALRDDGVTPSRVSDTSFDGNAMMEWPKIYTKRWEENGVYHFRCSSVKHDDNWDCWCNYNVDDEEIDNFYTSIYTVSESNKSIGGQAPKTTYKYTTSELKLDGLEDGWYSELISDRLLILDLLVMMAKSTDGQSTYGQGYKPSYVSDSSFDMGTVALRSGTMDTKGMFWGSSDSLSGGVKVFGMENWWGNLPRTVVGLLYNMSYDYYRIKITPGKHDGTTVVGYYEKSEEEHNTGVGYLQFNGIVLNRGYMNGSVTKPYGRLPASTDGSATTYETDYIHGGVNDAYIRKCRTGLHITYKDDYNIGMYTFSWETKYSTSALSYRPQST